MSFRTTGVRPEVMGFHALGVTWLDSKDYSWVITPLNKEGGVGSATIQGDWEKK